MSSHSGVTVWARPSYKFLLICLTILATLRHQCYSIPPRTPLTRKRIISNILTVRKKLTASALVATSMLAAISKPIPFTMKKKCAKLMPISRTELVEDLIARKVCTWNNLSTTRKANCATVSRLHRRVTKTFKTIPRRVCTSSFYIPY